MNNMNVNILVQKRNVILWGIFGGGLCDRMEEMLGFYEKSGIKLVVVKEFVFGEFKEVMKLLDDGVEVFGKIVVKVS